MSNVVVINDHMTITKGDVSHERPLLDIPPYYRGENKIRVKILNMDRDEDINSHTGITKVVIYRGNKEIDETKAQFDNSHIPFTGKELEFEIDPIEGAYLARVYFKDLESEFWETNGTTLEKVRQDDVQIATPRIMKKEGGRSFYGIEVKDKRYVKSITVFYNGETTGTVYEYAALQESIIADNIPVPDSTNSITISGVTTFTTEVRFYTTDLVFKTKPHDKEGLVGDGTYEIFFSGTKEISRYGYYWYDHIIANFDTIVGIYKAELYVHSWFGDNVGKPDILITTLTDIKSVKNLRYDLNFTDHNGAYYYLLYESEEDTNPKKTTHLGAMNGFDYLVWSHYTSDKFPVDSVIETNLAGKNKDIYSPDDMRALMPIGSSSRRKLKVKLRIEDDDNGATERELTISDNPADGAQVTLKYIENDIEMSIDTSGIAQTDSLYTISYTHEA